MSVKNIVIAPCGNKSHLFREQWLKYKDEKEFDLCLLFYHEHINNEALYKEVDFFYHLKDFKYHMLYNLLVNIHPEWLNEYDYFYFLDDDIEIDTHGINNMFVMSRAMNSAISQACLTQDSFCSWPIFKQQKNSFCRFVGQIEVMAPLFQRDVLRLCLPSFIGNKSSWGVDSVWSKLLDYPKDKLMVFDTITMRHTQPVGGGELYTKIGIDPITDWENIVRKFDAKKQNYQEYGRLQLVNSEHNRLKFRYYKWKEFWGYARKYISDFDVPSRVAGRLRRIRRKIFSSAS